MSLPAFEDRLQAGKVGVVGADLLDPSNQLRVARDVLDDPVQDLFNGEQGAAERICDI